MSAMPVDHVDREHPPGEGPSGEDSLMAGEPVVVRRRAGVAAAVGAGASAVAILYLWRASQTLAMLDWAVFGVMALIAAYYLATLIDARTPLLVVDDLGVRIRLGHEWRGLPWDAVGRIVVRPARGPLRDGRLVLQPRSLARVLAGLDGRGRRQALVNQKMYGAPLAVPLGSTTRASARGEHGVAAGITALAMGRAEVVELDPTTLEVVDPQAQAADEHATDERVDRDLTAPDAPSDERNDWEQAEDERDEPRDEHVAEDDVREATSVQAAVTSGTEDAAVVAPDDANHGETYDAALDAPHDLAQAASYDVAGGTTATGAGGGAEPAVDPAVDPAAGGRRRGVLAGLATFLFRIGSGRRAGEGDEGREVDEDRAAAEGDQGLREDSAEARDRDGHSDHDGGSDRDSDGRGHESAPTPLPPPVPLRQARPGRRAEATIEATYGAAALDPVEGWANDGTDRADERRLPEGRELRRPGSVDLVVEPVRVDARVRPISTLGDPVEPLVIDDYVTEPAYDPVIGPELSAARTRLGLSVDELAERTRIRPHVIESIEVDDFAPCGGDFYARGHLRTLARILGKDPAPLLEAYEERYATAPINARRVFEAELATGMTGSMRSTVGGPNWGLLAAMVLSLVLVWGVVRLFTTEPPELVEVPAPALNGSAGLAGADSGADGDERGGQQPILPDPVKLRLSASQADSRVVVRDAAGTVVFAGQLVLGERKTLEVAPPVRVRARNGGAVEVRVAGRELGFVGQELGEPARRTFRVPDRR